MGSETVNNPVEDVLADTPELAPLPRPSGGPRFPNPDTLQRQGPLVDMTPPPGYAGAAAAAPGVISATIPASPYRPWVQQAGKALGPLGTAIGAADTMGNTLAKSLPNIPAAPLGMAMPPAAGLLGRSALQGGAAGIEAAQAGKGLLDIAKEAGKGAAFNVGAEKMLGPLLRLIGRQAAPANAAAKEAHDIAMTGATNATEQTAYKAAQVAHAEAGAKNIAQDLIGQVPALKGTEASGKGLYDAIYGSGKDKVSAAFDQALKDVAAKGKGQIIQIPAQAADRMGLTGTTGGLPLEIAQRLKFRPGEAFPGMPGQPGMVGIDAADLAQKMTGFWKKDPGAYRAAATALDEAGVGDPAARAAYKTWAGMSDFIDKAKALDANGVLDPSKLFKAFSDLKKVEILRRRGLGSGTEGTLQEAARGGPLAPTPREVPVQPNDISGIRNPFAGHPLIAGLAGGGAGATAGHVLGMGGLGHLLGFLGGAGAAQAAPKMLVTKGPLSAAAQKSATNLPDIAGILARLGYNRATE